MLTLKALQRDDLFDLWYQSYREKDPEWAKFDAPYFHEYTPLTLEEFEEKQLSFFLSHRVKGIFINQKVIGCVTYYWEDKRTQWLEIGITIFDPAYWSLGYGSKAMSLWTTEMFAQHQLIERVGYTTWSGNKGMMMVGEKIGFKLEGQIRKVRFYQGVYYDSIKMGVTREEWSNK